MAPTGDPNAMVSPSLRMAMRSILDSTPAPTAGDSTGWGLAGAAEAAEQGHAGLAPLPPGHGPRGLDSFRTTTLSSADTAADPAPSHYGNLPPALQPAGGAGHGSLPPIHEPVSVTRAHRHTHTHTRARAQAHTLARPTASATHVRRHVALFAQPGSTHARLSAWHACCHVCKQGQRDRVWCHSQRRVAHLLSCSTATAQTKALTCNPTINTIYSTNSCMVQGPCLVVNTLCPGR